MLTPGTRLGPYEVLAPLGAGGMGEVYRARDTRLGREVAIKVLPEGLAGDPERVARFEREARSASSLSHAHTVSVFDVGRAGDRLYLVTEIVEGGSLRDVVDRGPVPLRRAIDLAAQIASGLAAAHESGIVHRDLKPENVLIARTGEAKIADFGLAKLAEPEGGSDSHLPTSDGLSTSAGLVMGTVAYMSPEQASGRKVDFRSDQFALGAILWEMLAGRPCFRRASTAETLSAIMRDEPEPVRGANSAVPPQLAWIVERCLAKEPTGRYASTRDLASEIATVRDHLSDLVSGGASPVGLTAPTVTRHVSPALPWAVATAAVIAAVAGFVWRRGPNRASNAAVVRLQLLPPADGHFFGRFDAVTLAFSPDGSRLAFVGEQPGGLRGAGGQSSSLRTVWIRALSELEAHPVSGTEGVTSVFWSPDGRSLGFVSEGRLKRVDLSGTSPAPVCDIPSGTAVSGTWGAGEILFCSPLEGIIYHVPADGSRPPTPLVRPDPARGQTRLGWPYFLPDGRSFLYVASRKDGTSELEEGSLEGRLARDIAPISSRVEYSDPGFLVHARDGVLFAQRFDAKTARLTGPLLPLAPSVYNFFTSRWASFAVSRNGMLAYSPRGNVTRLTWYDRAGRPIGDVGSAGAGETINLDVSPDGRNVLFDRTRLDVGTFDVWMIDLARGIETRLTSDPNTEFDPVWLPDGKGLIYSAVGISQPRLVRRNLSGGPEEALLPSGTFQEALGVTPDGRRLLFSQSGPKRTWGLWMLSLSGDPSPKPVAVSRANSGVGAQEVGRLSPDGRFLAYLSDESGRMEAYVTALDGSSEKLRLSIGGATLIRWTRDGREIFYTSPDGKLMAVPIKTSPSLQAGTETPLFTLPAKGWTAFDVAPDGRILAAVREVSNETSPLTVVANWTSDIRP